MTQLTSRIRMRQKSLVHSSHYTDFLGVSHKDNKKVEGEMFLSELALHKPEVHQIPMGISGALKMDNLESYTDRKRTIQEIAREKKYQYETGMWNATPPPFKAPKCQHCGTEMEDFGKNYCHCTKCGLECNECGGGSNEDAYPEPDKEIEDDCEDELHDWDRQADNTHVHDSNEPKPIHMESVADRLAKMGLSQKKEKEDHPNCEFML